MITKANKDALAVLANKFAKDKKYNAESVRDLLVSARNIDSLVNQHRFGSFGRMMRDAVPATAPLTGAGIFLEQQLTYIIPEILKQEVPATPALKIFQVDNSGTWDKQIITRMGTFEGRHQPINNGVTKDSTITVGRVFNGMLVVDHEGTSHYTLKELMKAKQLGENIDTDIIEAHNTSYNTIVDEVVWRGVMGDPTTTNLYAPGLANSHLIVSGNKINAGHDWSDPATTGNDIVNDLLALQRQIYGLGGGNDLWNPNTIVLSPAKYNIIATANFSVTGFTTSETVMSYCKAKYGWNFYSTNQVIGLSEAAVGEDRTIMFNNDKRALRLHIPRPLEWYPLEAHRGKFDLTSAFSVAGLNVVQSSTFGYLDHI